MYSYKGEFAVVGYNDMFPALIHTTHISKYEAVNHS